MTEEPHRIVCAALRSRITGTVVPGPRHFDATMCALIQKLPPDNWLIAEHGFLDTHGQFLTRQEAWAVAEANGQIVHRCGGDAKELFSENLY